MKSADEEVVLIMAHTPTLKKIDLLRDLVKSINNLGYKICLVTHTSTPQDIIDRCDYFIFDKKNELNYEPDIAYWVHHDTHLFKLKYKQYDCMSTHIVPIYRLVAGALSYLKTLKVDKIYLIEHDTIVHNDAVFNQMSSDLDLYDISTFCTEKANNKNRFLLFPIGIKLQSLDLTKLIKNSENLIDLYRSYFYTPDTPTTERIMYDYLWSGLNIKWNTDLTCLDMSLSLGLSDKDSNYGNGYTNKTYLFHIHNDALHFFAQNSTETEWNFDIVINNVNKQINVQPKTWKWVPLNLISDVNQIKLILNDVVVKNLDLSNKYDYDLISEFVEFTLLEENNVT